MRTASLTNRSFILTTVVLTLVLALMLLYTDSVRLNVLAGVESQVDLPGFGQARGPGDLQAP